MEDLKTFLINKVLLFESDTLPRDTEKVLQQVRREKPVNPVIFVSSGTSSVIAGSEETYNAIKTYIKENVASAELISVGCTGPANFEPLVCIQIPGKINCFSEILPMKKLNLFLRSFFIMI